MWEAPEWRDVGLHQSPVVTEDSWQPSMFSLFLDDLIGPILFFVICPFSLLSLKMLFLSLLFYSLIRDKFLGIDLSVLECSIIHSVLKNSHPFLYLGLHVLIDSVLFTIYIWSLLGKVMTCLQVERMRLTCLSLYLSKLWALKWTRLFADFIRSFLRLRRTPNFGHMSTLELSFCPEMICWPPCCTYWHSWLCYHITPSPSCVWKPWNPASRSGVLPQAWVSGLQTSYRNWSNP